MERPVAEYRIGENFLFIPAQRRIRSATESVTLQPKPYEVLVQLVERPNEIVSREHLLQQVWPGVTVAPDSVENCIAQLRSLFGDKARNPTYIETVQRVGYRLIAPVQRIEPPVEAAPAPSVPTAPAFDLWPIAWACGVLAAAMLLRIAVAEPPSQAEAAWWSFDEAGTKVEDSSGNGQSGHLTNGVKRTRGPLGGAIQLDGIGGHVGGSRPGRLPMGDTPRTITAMIKVDQPPGTDVNLFHYGSSTARTPAANMHLLLGPAGSLAFGNGYGFGTIQGGPSVTDGKWHIVAGAYHGDAKARIYVDGAEVKSGNLRQRPDTGNASNWTIGLFMGGGQPLNGIIDDVRVYGRALRSTEMFALHRCVSRIVDLSLGRLGPGYLLPVFDFAADVLPREPGDLSAAVRFGGMDHVDERPRGGFQFAVPSTHCGIESIRGAPMPDAFDVSMEVKVESGGPDHKTGAGALIGMEPMTPGDMPETGHRGYSIRLESDGAISVFRLHRPDRPLVSANAKRPFDSARFHRLETRIRSRAVQVLLDGEPVDLPFVLDDTARGTAVGVGFFVDGKPLRGREPRARALSVTPIQ